MKMNFKSTAATVLVALGGMTLLSACVTTQPTSTAPQSSGSAGGMAAVGNDSSLQTCNETTGTVRLQDGQASADTSSQAGGGSPALESVRGLLRDLNGYSGARGSNQGSVTIDSLRLLIQQSNCLVIVERGIGEAGASDEKRRARGPNSEVRDDANMGQGQEVAADFVLRAIVIGVNNNEESSRVNLGAFIPFKALSSVSANKSISSADVQLVLSDVRSKVQLAVAQGHGTGANTGIATSLLGGLGRGLGGGQASTESNTSASKILLQAYADAYNKLVPALKNYKAQMVRGGLGAGGTLGVQGSRTDPSNVRK